MSKLNSTPARVLLAAIISGRQSFWSLGVMLSPDELVAVAQREGIVALVDWRFQQAVREFTNIQTKDASAIPPGVIKAFTSAAREETLVSMVIEGESRRVLGLIAKAGLSGLLLKGSALAYWAYPEQHLRACSDVDLLLPSRDAAEQLSDRLTAEGFERDEPSGDLVAYELLCRRSMFDDWQMEIDIHWRLANSPLFANAFTFDELMAESIALPNLASNARGLGPVHALMHACVHRALNLSIGVGDKLKWQYDVEVLRANFTLVDWHRLIDLSVLKGLAGVVKNALENAAETFETQLPDAWIIALANAESMEILDARRLSEWRYMQLMTFKSLPTAFLKLQWLWQRLFPSLDDLRLLYGSHYKSYCHLIFLRFLQLFKLLKR